MVRMFGISHSACFFDFNIVISENGEGRMKWIGGLSWEAREKRRKQKEEWHQWFAWFPVTVDLMNKTTVNERHFKVWLEIVWRKGTYHPGAAPLCQAWVEWEYSIWEPLEGYQPVGPRLNRQNPPRGGSCLKGRGTKTLLVHPNCEYDIVTVLHHFKIPPPCFNLISSRGK